MTKFIKEDEFFWNIRSEFGDNKGDLFFLEEIVLATLLDDNERIRKERKEWLSEMLLVYNPKIESITLYDMDKVDLNLCQNPKRIIGASHADNQIFLRVEDKYGFIEDCYLCELPKVYIDKVDPKKVKGFSMGVN
jgi:hypothetical protein